MKRVLFTLLAAMTATHILAKSEKDIVIKQTEGAITFVVDENLPAPKNHLHLVTGSEMANWEMGNGKGTQAIVASSFDDAKLYFEPSSNVLFSMIARAYAEHRPLVLSPDDVWLCISQGFAHHVNQNAETLRDKLVFHEGKITLKVETRQPLLEKMEGDANPNDWAEIFDGFATQLKNNTKDHIAENMCADFSTTTTESLIASQITLMNTMQPYFNYVVGRISCGIPYITLKGTPEDWQKVLEKARTLEKYELKWWTDKLCPVLEEFVKTSQGKPNHQFWRCMVTQIEIDKIRGGGCSNLQPTLFDGWFLALFPYDTEGRTPEKVSLSHKMLHSFESVDFLYCLQDEEGYVLMETPMKFHAGFVGIEENTETYELTPRIGWMVRTDEKPAKEKEEN